MKPTLRFLRLLSLAGLAGLTGVRAQPGGAPAVSLMINTAVTGHSDFSARGSAAGGFSVQQASARLSVPLPPLDRTWFPALGLDYRHVELDLDAGTPLPARWQSLGLSLSAVGNLAPDWKFFGSLKPDVSNAGGGFSSRGLGVGVIAIASRTFSKEFSAGFGFVYDSLARGSGRLIPVATFDWLPAAGWRVYLGYPRTGVSWQINPDLKAEFVAEADFGSTYVTDDPRPGGRNQPALNRTRLEYQAVRFGPALTWRFSPGFSARIAAGAVPVLNAEYHQRNYKLKSEDTVGFASLELDWKF